MSLFISYNLIVNKSKEARMIGLTVLTIAGIGAVVFAAWLADRFVESTRESVDNIRKISRHIDGLNDALDRVTHRAEPK